MSAQKLLAEADKLLEKGKVAEAVTKIKSAVAEEPANQLIVTKLVELYLHVGKVAEAAQAYVQLAERLSEAGKSQVAVAVYKKALEVIPGDFTLRSKFVAECERAGKLGEAYAGAQDLLSYLLPRKKYFEALNIFCLVNRVQARDVNFRPLWLDILIKTQSEQKLVHFLVAIFGPPGISSPEIPTGGEPSELSPDFFKKCKEIVNWFPRSAHAAYALAWAAYRRNELKEAYRFLRETIRRDPDFTLGYLLFARILSENKFLNECMYVFKQAKDSLPLDRSGDPLMLNQQLDGFVSKNGWLSFASGSDEEYSPQQFLASIKGEKQEQEAGSVNVTSLFNFGDNGPAKVEDRSNETSAAFTVPAEIEINLAPATDEVLEIQNNQSVRKVQFTPTSNPQAPSKDHVEKEESSVNLTSIIKIEPGTLKERAVNEQSISGDLDTPPEKIPHASRPQFDPFAEMNSVQTLSPVVENPTGTKQFSPLELLRATTIHKERTKKLQQEIKPQAIAPPPIPEELPVEPPVFVDGERTMLFSPIEALGAGIESQKNRVIATKEEHPPPAAPPELPLQEDATVLVQKLEASLPIDDSVASGATANGEKNIPTELAADLVELPQVEFDATKLEKFELETFARDTVVTKNKTQSPTNNSPSIPELGEHSLSHKTEQEPVQEVVDRGSDLLAGPTRIIERPIIETEGTELLIRELAKDTPNRTSYRAESLLQKAERYLGKRNYYLARKSLRHARLLGADEQLIKSKLREVRIAELPNSMYAAISTDVTKTSDSHRMEDSAIFEYLDSSEENKALAAKADRQMQEAINAIESNDSKSLLDLGIGLSEMGLFDGAEKLFEKVIEVQPEESFNAYFLMGQARMARGDYARAVSIFKKLIADRTREEKEKISIYYSLGEALEKMQQPDRSRTYFEKVAEMDANYRNVKEKISG